MKTYHPKGKDVKRDWHFVDARGKILGRMATQIATYLMGKHKPSYSRHLDMGDYVVVVNAGEVEVTGRKEKQKEYYSHSGYPGGFKITKFSKLKKEQPEKIIERAVFGMLPKNRLQSPRLRRLKVFAGDKHTYEDKFNKKGES